MKIRTLVILMLVPLFIFVAFTSGFLRYRSEKNELLWGVEQEGKGIAIALAAHLEEHSFADLSSGKLKSQLQKIFSWGKLQKILLRTKGDDLNVWEFKPDGSITQSVKNLPVYLNDQEQIYFEYKDENTLRTWVHMKPTDKENSFLLGSETNISHIQPILFDIQIEIVKTTAGVMLIALILAAGLSRIISKKVRQLTTSLTSSEINSNFLNDGIIREINDLNNTFKTMDSLLKEAAENIQRSTVNFSRACSAEELSEAYNQIFLPPLDLALSEKEKSPAILIKLAKDSSALDFYEVASEQNNYRIIIGSFPVIKNHEQWKERSAAQTFIKQLLANQQKFETVSELSKRLYPDLSLKEIIIPNSESKSSSKIKVHEFTPALGRSQTEAILNGKTLMFHTLESKKAVLIEEYVRAVKASSPKQLFAELNPILRKHEKGVVLLIGAET